jgi:transketolase
MPTPLERANAIRFLSIDAVQQANSGHPGMPMGMADIAEVLWHDFLRHNPKDPHWINRDRFILSNGHGSMLQYALLHLTGYDVSIEDLKQFRQLHSKTPGHPEYGYTPGVETTTGPLGQGLGHAVGMAMAEMHLAAQFNQPGLSIVDHYTYCFVGDGCLMEGISHEVASLAGVLQLNKLIVFYDDNGISIDGEVKGWFRDNTPMRFRAYGWHVIDKVNGHDREAITRAIQEAKSQTDQPTLICCQTTIGWGSPKKAGTAAVHGSALGQEEVEVVRQQLNWPHVPFVVSDEMYADWDARTQGEAAMREWNSVFAQYKKQHPQLAQEFERRLHQHLPADWSAQAAALVDELSQHQEPMASRKASGLCLNRYTALLPEMMGGSADLTESNCTDWKGATVFSHKTPAGCYVHYGVREFGMSAIMTGMALHRGVIPFGGTFLTFSDYARNALRLAAMMKQRVIFVYTHDSIGLGEDGPTHQPIEHLPSLRLIPHLSVWRPCDAVETAVAWRVALETQGPTCLLLSRQNLPLETRSKEQMTFIARGGYVLWEAQAEIPAVIFIATGSEVSLAVNAAKQLQAEGVPARVVSMPSVDVFLKQSDDYRQAVLPDAVSARVVIEAARCEDWYPLIGAHGKTVGLNDYGASAPAKDIFRERGFTVEHVMRIAKQAIDH